MPPTFFARFFFMRAAVVAAVCLLVISASLIAPSLGAGQRGVAHLAPPILIPLFATPMLLALGER